ncbi:hypothetical protein FHETE_7076 [Fusarium heterosporum]|uniref:Uncharacterized protein n=1 Tax=Fusarium heterosporum TaxID=42747 RepID=A0A8H5T8C6_FUSHE|nr:hypothetical protein FHETE_7076 [Fusarium heterosporum]
MKTTTFAVALLGLLPTIFAQAPSPTESVGCEPHGDHWHCEAARTDAGAAATTGADHDHDDDHEHSLTDVAGATESLAPSPTASIGCEPHGDHWHCEGARSSEAKATSEAEHDHDEDDHDHDATGSESLAPSPTESVGCEPHGDHWHCEGARTGAAVSTTTDAEHSHTHSAGATESLAPSPTESVGCEPHGDHWHCDGPATAASDGTPTSSSESSAVTDNAAAIQFVPFAGMVAAAVLAL